MLDEKVFQRKIIFNSCLIGSKSKFSFNSFLKSLPDGVYAAHYYFMMPKENLSGHMCCIKKVNGVIKTMEKINDRSKLRFIGLDLNQDPEESQKKFSLFQGLKKECTSIKIFVYEENK
jgi:hypothetical protein